MLPLPPQLELKQLSKAFRIQVWNILFEEFERTQRFSSVSPSTLGADWPAVLKQVWFKLKTAAHDEFDDSVYGQSKQIKALVYSRPYNEVFDFIERLLEHEYSCVNGIREKIERAFTDCRMAYRLANGKTVQQVGSEEHAQAIDLAYSSISEQKFSGARTHLARSAEQLREGNWRDSIRESMHAVVSVCRTIDPTAKKLSDALSNIDRDHPLHGGLTRAFGSLYGWVSDDKGGIRKEILEEKHGEVDEELAMFMNFSCAAFISYILAKTDSQVTGSTL